MATFFSLPRQRKEGKRKATLLCLYILCFIEFLENFCLFEPKASSENFREENSMKQRKQGKAGALFFWLLFFGEAKKSNSCFQNESTK